MDLRLYGRVIWRFRIIVAIGVVLAIVLAAMSVVRVSPSGVTYRQSEDWSASTTYLLTASGGPSFGVYSAGGARSPLALASLASLYATYATGDDVRRRLRAGGPLHGIVTSNAFVNTQTAQKYPLPLFAITADASSPEKAVRLARRAAAAFEGYVVEQQNKANIKPASRVQLQIVNHPNQAQLVAGRKKTLPAVIFLTILTATLGLAFVLENLRPRVHPVSTLEDDRDERPRRSA